MFNEITNLLKGPLRMLRNVPASFWGVIVGSIFTLSAVILTNWDNRRRLLLQFEHDRNMRRQDWDLSMRTNVYMAAAEAVAVTIDAVGRMGSLSVTVEEILRPVTECAPALAKVDVIAANPTLTALAKLRQEVTGAFFRLALQRMRAEYLKLLLESASRAVDSSSLERDRILALMQDANLAVMTDQPRWTAMKLAFDAEMKRGEEAFGDREQLQRESSEVNFALAQRSADEVARLAQHVGAVLQGARAELGLPFDIAYYAQIVERQYDRHRRDIDDFIDAARSQINSWGRADKDIGVASERLSGAGDGDAVQA